MASLSSFLPELCDAGETTAGKIAYKIAGETTFGLLASLLIAPLVLYTYDIFVSNAAELDSKLVVLRKSIEAICDDFSEKNSDSIVAGIVQLKSLSTTLNDSCKSLQITYAEVRAQLKNVFAETVWSVLKEIGIVAGGSVTTVTSVAMVADAVKGDRGSKASYVKFVWDQIKKTRNNIVCAFAEMWETLYKSVTLAKTVCTEPELLLPSLEGGYGKLRL